MYISENIVTNDDLSKTLDTSDEWISTRTGIKERRITKDFETNKYITTQACKSALENSDLRPEDIHVFIVATFSPDRLLPSTACMAQETLGLRNAWAFDLNAACTGFLYSLELAAGLLENHPEWNILISGSERISKVVDWTDKSTCVLFGDGAGAFIVNKDTSIKHEISYMILGSDGALWKLITIPYGGAETPLTPENINENNHYIKMEGKQVFKNAIRAMVGSCNKVLEYNNLSIDQIQWLVPHQANQRILDAVGKKLGIDPDRVFSNLKKYGNISAASVPLAICELSEQLEEGDKIILTAFGAGVTWGAALMTW